MFANCPAKGVNLNPQKTTSHAIFRDIEGSWMVRSPAQNASIVRREVPGKKKTIHNRLSLVDSQKSLLGPLPLPAGRGWENLIHTWLCTTKEVGHGKAN